MTPHDPGSTSTDDGTAARVVDRLVAADGLVDLLGITVEEVAAGRVVASMVVTAGLCNGLGTGHGGIVFALADVVFALACNSHGDRAVAQAADITYLAPTQPGDVLVATGVERHRAGRSGLTDVTVLRRHDDTVVAEFRGRSRRIGGRVLDDHDDHDDDGDGVA